RPHDRQHRPARRGPRTRRRDGGHRVHDDEYFGGHINPAVTLGLWLGERFEGRRVGPYILAQILGAVAGAALVKAVFPPMAVGLALVGTPRLATEVGFMQGVWIEALLTFFLVSAVFGTAVSSEAPKIAGFGIGLA